MKKQHVKEVMQWRVPWDSTLSFIRNSNRLLIGTLEYSAGFDLAGKMTEEGIYINEMNKSWPYHYFYYSYDPQGRLAETKYLYAPNRVDTNLSSVRRRYYDNRSRLHHELVWQPGIKNEWGNLPVDSIQYEYDKLGRLGGRVYFHAIPGDRSGKRLLEIYSYRYFYNTVGELTTESWEDYDTVYRKIRWKYDDYGRRKTEEEYLNAAHDPAIFRSFDYQPGKMTISETIYTPPLPTGMERKQIWYYDAEGKVVGCVENSGDGSEPVCYVYRYSYYE